MLREALAPPNLFLLGREWVFWKMPSEEELPPANKQNRSVYSTRQTSVLHRGALTDPTPHDPNSGLELASQECLGLENPLSGTDQSGRAGPALGWVIYGRGCRPDPDLAQPRPPPPTHLLALVKTDSRAPGDPQPCLSPTQTSKEASNLHPADQARWPKGHPLPRVARQAPGPPVRGKPQVNCQHTLSTRVSGTLHKTLTQNVADLISTFN